MLFYSKIGHMTDQTISELLVLFLIGFSCSRIFFHRQVKSDTLSVLPAVALLISLLNIFAWGVSLVELVNVVFSLFVTMWNIRALLRLNAQLVIDHYSPWFVIVSILNLVIAVFFVIIVIVYRPVKIDAKKQMVNETVIPYSGSFESGFTPVTKPFQKATARVWKYELQSENAQTAPSTAVATATAPSTTTPATTAATGSSATTTATTQAPQTVAPAPAAPAKPVSKATILFIADKCSSVQLNRPFLIMLAHDGYTVYAAEFYAKDMKWFNAVADSALFRRFTFCEKKLRHPQEHASYSTRFNTNLVAEYNTFINLVYPNDDSRKAAQKGTVILVGDEIARKALSYAVKENSRLVDGSYNLTAVENYTTGLGPVEQTEPVLAKILGRNRDTSLFMSAHMAHTLEKAIAKKTTPKRILRSPATPITDEQTADGQQEAQIDTDSAENTSLEGTPADGTPAEATVNPPTATAATSSPSTTSSTRAAGTSTTATATVPATTTSTAAAATPATTATTTAPTTAASSGTSPATPTTPTATASGTTAQPTTATETSTATATPSAATTPATDTATQQ
jgi:hypothetical protein